MGRKKQREPLSGPHYGEKQTILSYAPLSDDVIERIRKKCKSRNVEAYHDPMQFRDSYHHFFGNYLIYSGQASNTHKQLREYFADLNETTNTLSNLLAELNSDALYMLSRAESTWLHDLYSIDARERNLIHATVPSVETEQLTTFIEQVKHLRVCSAAVQEKLAGKGKGPKHPYSERLHWLTRFMGEMHISLTSAKPTFTKIPNEGVTGCLVTLVMESVPYANIQGAEYINGESVATIIRKEWGTKE